MTVFTVIRCRDLEGVSDKEVLDNLSSQDGRKEGNVLFNDALNSFYLWLYGVRRRKILLLSGEQRSARTMNWFRQIPLF